MKIRYTFRQILPYHLLDQYRAFIYCKASDSGKWIDVYKSSKDGNWYMYKWMDLITSIKAQLQVIHSKYVFEV